MKSIMSKKILTLLAVGLLAQPIIATDTVNDCFQITDTEVNVKKFSKVWQELHKDSKVSQDHLQNYIEITLDRNAGTLDVEKFSHAWQKLNSGKKSEKTHLHSYVENLLDSASKSLKCSSEPLICTSTIDVAKFSTLWNEVKIKENASKHLTGALDSLVSVKHCTI